jgi:hypothetical protein
LLKQAANIALLRLEESTGVALAKTKWKEYGGFIFSVRAVVKHSASVVSLTCTKNLY